MKDRKVKQSVKRVFREASSTITVSASKYHWDDVIRDKAAVHVDTYADYIPGLRVLVVDQMCVVENDWRGLELQWNLPDRRTMETHETEAAAIRRAVALADEYYRLLVETAVDDTRSDDEIIAAYHAANPDEEEQLTF